MNALLKRIWNENEGVLTFEWILLITLVVIGVVGGYSAVRDGVIDELGDIAGAIVAVDQSFTTEQSPCVPGFHLGSFQDTPNEVVHERPAEPPISQE